MSAGNQLKPEMTKAFPNTLLNKSIRSISNRQPAANVLRRSLS